MELFIQLIGALGVVASIISFQCKKHRSILIFRTLNEGIFTVQYILLGAYTGAAMNIVGCTRNMIFAKQKGGTKKTVVLFSILFFVFGLLTWQGLKSLLIIVAKVLSTIAYGNKNTTVVRAIIFFTSVSWLLYSILIGTVAGAVNEALTIGSILVGIVRLDVIPRLKKEKPSAT